MKFIRLALALLFLASTTLGVVAGAHAACEENTEMTNHTAHGHAPRPSAHHHGDASSDDDGGARDNAASGPTCHTSAGCPGCVSVGESALPAFSATPIAFRPTAESGQSAEPDTKLRPPKFS